MTHTWTNPAWAAAPIVCCAAAAHAQTVIDARVASIAGQSVYIDAGREQGVTPGVRVVMFLANGERLEAAIINVTSNNARAELPAGSTFPEVGARCEVTLATEPAPTSAPEPPRPVPAHPPWQRQTESRTSDTPLLAPAFGTKPSDRPTTLHGRVYSSLRHSHDTQNESDFTYGRLGTWMELTNPFKDAGRTGDHTRTLLERFERMAWPKPAGGKVATWLKAILLAARPSGPVLEELSP